jgi:AbrB family looped-hinge helix DNA binding protein
MKTSLSSKGQIIIPATLRQQDRLVPGQQFEVERVQAGEYVIKKISRPGQPGLLEWLRRCPESNWFQPLPADSTADL